MIRLKPMMLTAKGQMPMPASRPDCAGSRLNSFAQVSIRNMRAMKPNAVVTRAAKQPQKRILFSPADAIRSSGLVRTLVMRCSLGVWQKYERKAGGDRCQSGDG